MEEEIIFLIEITNCGVLRRGTGAMGWRVRGDGNILVAVGGGPGSTERGWGGRRTVSPAESQTRLRPRLMNRRISGASARMA
eukprot:128499-Prorocentrum_minimum.AAC.1